MAGQGEELEANVEGCSIKHAACIWDKNLSGTGLFSPVRTGSSCCNLGFSFISLRLLT